MLGTIYPAIQHHILEDLNQQVIQAQYGKYLLHVLGLFYGIFRRVYIKFGIYSNDFQFCKFMVFWEKRCFKFRSLQRLEVAGFYKMLRSVYQTVWCHIP